VKFLARGRGRVLQFIQDFIADNKLEYHDYPLQGPCRRFYLWWL